jgi:hypothetical protein
MTSGRRDPEGTVDHVVQVPLRERLLLGAHAHLELLADGPLPLRVRLEEGVVLERVLGALDVDGLQLVRGIHELVVDDVLRRHPQEARLRHGEEAADVGRVAGPHLQRAVDVGEGVGIAVGEGVDGQLVAVREPADEPARGPGGHAGHLDQDALRLAPVLVVVEPLEDAAGLDGEDIARLGFELEVLDAARNGVRAGAEARAVDLDLLARLRVAVDDDQVAGHGPAVVLGVEA